MRPMIIADMTPEMFSGSRVGKYWDIHNNLLSIINNLLFPMELNIKGGGGKQG